MFCSKCGTQNEDDAKYCKNCGNALMTPQSQQAVPATRTQLPGVACHYPGCTEPVIGQCPGYKGSCLRYYCATHSIEPYCSVCADKILRDVAIETVYKDYLEEAKKISTISWGCIVPLMFVGILVALTGGLGSGSAIIGIGTIIFLLFLKFSSERSKKRRIAQIASTKPGFEEFYAEYERQKNSERMASALTGLLVAGAAARAIEEYQMRQDIHEIVRKMKS